MTDVQWVHCRPLNKQEQDYCLGSQGLTVAFREIREDTVEYAVARCDPRDH